MPVVPAFYYAPQTIDDLVEQFVCRALAQIGLPQEHQYKWEGQAKARAREA
jgi:3-polyprenyl-4-hydroxybenzoate decarboxylase